MSSCHRSRFFCKLAFAFALLFVASACDPAGDARKELVSIGVQYTPENFVKAAHDNDLRAVELFLRAGMDVNVTAFRTTALDQALDEGYRDIAYVLLNAGGKAASRNLNKALLAAVHDEDADMIGAMAKAGADLSKGLAEASRNGSAETVQLLVDLGADASGGLLSALEGDHMKVVEFLAKRGASGASDDLRLHLRRALLRGDEPGFDLLVGLGADPQELAHLVPPAEVFRDKLKNGSVGPIMAVIPAGRFRMGCSGCSDDRWHRHDNLPVHDVWIQSFALSAHEVTFYQWNACVADGGCQHRPGDNGWGRESRPVIGVSYNDASEFAEWFSSQTVEEYRLSSEAEWEYAARAGTETKHHWGDQIGVNNANCDGCGSQWDERRTAPVGSFRPNAWGLHDMHGNVKELVADCWNDSYKGAPSDGSAWTTGDCDAIVNRGGSWYSDREYMTAWVRSESSDRMGGRDWGRDRGRYPYLGFRVARTLP